MALPPWEWGGDDWVWWQAAAAAALLLGMLLADRRPPAQKGGRGPGHPSGAAGCTLPGCVRCERYRDGTQPPVDPVNQQPTVCLWPGLLARPVWRDFPRQGWMEALAARYHDVVQEAKELLEVGDAWQDTPLVTGGRWGNASLINQGRVHPYLPDMAPVTWGLIQQGMREGGVMGTATSFANVFFSKVVPEGPGGAVDITPHHGATNVRLRCQVPLVQPEGGGGGAASLTVAGTAHAPRPPPAVFVFDDSYLHSVHATGLRVVLVVDLWHPDLTDAAREEVSAAYPPP
eukprot:TRINITY_DN18278_c0_g1_i1.p1 TRINITY_DN18278_c0_g1~~TRINITY_DN18278_c0_g1_i1.p1  ORF type:complete len:304 (+),score=84.41 TRINITY_DN18278_c0_g1_i1:51-914(+)